MNDSTNLLVKIYEKLSKKRESPLAEAFSLGEANFGLSSEERREIDLIIPSWPFQSQIITFCQLLRKGEFLLHTTSQNN